LHLEAPRFARLFQLLGQSPTNKLDRFIFILESNFSLGGVNVNVDLTRDDFEGEIYERMSTLCQKAGVEGLERSFEWRAIDEAV
jgi:hypothetical protein